MAASKQELTELREATRREITELREATKRETLELQNSTNRKFDSANTDLSNIHAAINKEFETIKSVIDQNKIGASHEVQATAEQILNQVQQAEEELNKMALGDGGGREQHRWNIKDPKARGTLKFAGDAKDDVKVFVQWRKHAVIYLEKFYPKIGKLLEDVVAEKMIDEFTVPN